MKKFVFIWGNYDGENICRYDTLKDLEDAATRVLAFGGAYGSHILFAGEVINEFEFQPLEVVTKHKAVRKENHNA